MKLLDEKGLTTVWAAIKNTFTSKSDADGKYAKKADLNPATSTSAGVMTAADKNKLDNIEEDANNYFLPLAANGTRGGIQLGRASISASDRFQYPLLVDGNEKAYVSIPYATSGLDGLMTSEDKDKLDGIATGANNYTLPTASTTTLGGIKVSSTSANSYESWPIIVDNTGTAYANIAGLTKNNNGSVGGINVISESHFMTYSSDSINNQDISSGESASFMFPSKSGTFALTSDIPDVSNICKFNNVTFISDCVSGRINLLIPNGRKVNLDDIKDKEDIIIFAILIGQSNVTCSDGFLYNNEDDAYTQKTLSGPLLITSGGGIISVYSL